MCDDNPPERGEGCEQTLQQACSQAYPGSARCVQRFDDSLDSAIRITYRISLRSSSLWEPRHPPVRVVWHFRFCQNRRSAPFYKSSRSQSFGVQHSLVRPYCFMNWRVDDWGRNRPHIHSHKRRFCAAGPKAVDGRSHKGRRPEGFAGLYKRMDIMVMILPQVHLRKPCYDFTFL